MTGDGKRSGNWGQGIGAHKSAETHSDSVILYIYLQGEASESVVLEIDPFQRLL